MGKSLQVHKAHKTRFASKASRHAHRISQNDKVRISKDSKGAGPGARLARLKRNKLERDQKRAALLKEKRALSGSMIPPRVIVLVVLSEKVDGNLLQKKLLKLLDKKSEKISACKSKKKSANGSKKNSNDESGNISDDQSGNISDDQSGNISDDQSGTISAGKNSSDESEIFSTTVASSFYKLRTTVLLAPYGDLLTCMEMAKIADLIAFVASGNVTSDACATGGFLDSFGRQCLSVFRAMGLPSTAVLIRDIPVEQKRRHEVKFFCMSCLSSELPEDCKYFLADTDDDLLKFIRLLKEQHFSLPHWRQHRPYILSQQVNLENVDACSGKCSLLLSGYVRAHRFSVNQLVHVSGAGDFQLSKIDVLKDPFPMNDQYSDSMYLDDHEIQVLPDPSKLEPLLVENIPDPLAGEQTWPTETEMADAEATNRVRKLRKKVLPEGTSDYQAAWIVEGTDDESIQSDDSEYDSMVLDEETINPLSVHMSDKWCSDDECCIKSDQGETQIDNVIADDENMTKEQIEMEIRRIRDAHVEDEEFPDEVESPFDIPARRRFAKYRGLKSFRTSSWDPKESLPPEYSKIFAFDNFTRTQKHVRSKVDEIDQGSLEESVPVGSYVRLHISEVPVDVASKLCLLPETSPIIASGLLQHESKMSVLHFSIKKHDSYDAPIKSKENLIFNVGFRQFFVRPLFSSDNLNSDKHKMEKFLQPGCFSIASVYCPISFPPLPLIVLKNKPGGQGQHDIAATGSLRSVDTDRIILKRIILTGYPQRVSKLKATVKYMFHHPEDVRWFKPVDVWTKYGRRGRVLEPVGTHGAMKCLFNGVVQQHDTVCMSLYKRTYPKWPGNHHDIYRV